MALLSISKLITRSVVEEPVTRLYPFEKRPPSELDAVRKAKGEPEPEPETSECCGTSEVVLCMK